jgi:hypothetical protein
VCWGHAGLQLQVACCAGPQSIFELWKVLQPLQGTGGSCLRTTQHNTGCHQLRCPWACKNALRSTACSTATAMTPACWGATGLCGRPPMHARTFALDVSPVCAVLTSTSMPFSSASMRPQVLFLQAPAHTAFSTTDSLLCALLWHSHQMNSTQTCVHAHTDCACRPRVRTKQLCSDLPAHLQRTFSTSVASACTSGLSLRASSSS